MRIPLLCLLLAALFPGLAEAQIQYAKGIYLISGLDSTSNIAADAALAYVSGGTLRITWAFTQPADAAPDFTRFDAMMGLILAAGKKATILVGAGNKAPCWLHNEGAPVYGDTGAFDAACLADPTQSFITADPTGTIIPIPWDAVHFLPKWTSFINALGAHIVAQGWTSDVLSVAVSGITRDGAEVALSNWDTDAAGWAALGYSEAVMDSTEKTLTTLFGTAFPSASLNSRFVYNGLPTPPAYCSPGSSSVYPRRFMEDMRETYPGRNVMMVNTLDNVSPAGNINKQMCPAQLTQSTSPALWVDCETGQSAGSCVLGHDLPQANDATGCQYYTWTALQMLNGSGGSGTFTGAWSYAQPALPTGLLWIEVYHADLNYPADVAALTAANTYLTTRTLTPNLGMGAAACPGGSRFGFWP